MPITQQRILALVEACEAYEEAFATLKETAKRLLDKSQGGDSRESREFIELYSAVILCEPSASAQVTIATERQRYNLTHKRNERHKRRQRAKRGETSARSTAFASAQQNYKDISGAKPVTEFDPLDMGEE